MIEHYYAPVAGLSILYAQQAHESLPWNGQLSMASQWALEHHTPAITALLILPCESCLITQHTNGTVKYDDSFENGKSRGGTIEEYGVHAKEMMDQAAI